jgi:hypothetical protein
MNIEEKFSHPEMEGLRAETAPRALASRILTSLNHVKEIKPAKKRTRMLRWGLSTVVLAGVAIAMMTMSRTASAAGLSKVKANFQSVQQYHIRTYRVAGEKRWLASETWVDHDKHEVVFYGEDGKKLDVPKVVYAVIDAINKKITNLTPEEVANPGKFNTAINDAVQRIDLQALNASSSESATTATGTPGAPLVLAGETNVEYLQKLMASKDIWAIEHMTLPCGTALDHYSLKAGLQPMELYVDSAAALPLLTRTEWSFMGQKMVVDDEYDYVTPILPPTSAKS